MRKVSTAGVSLSTYDDLYRYSIERTDEFWTHVWTFCGIRGAMGDRIVDDLDKMPGARFFPAARLNFAENLLRRRDSGPAIIFSGEGRRRMMSHGALYADVGRFAAALRAVGVCSGDRVAAYMPNLPETVVAALGTAGGRWGNRAPCARTYVACSGARLRRADDTVGGCHR